MSTLRRDGELPPNFLEALDRQDRLHRRKPELKIHGATHARVIVRELGMVSVNAATDLPNLIDPIVGRRASGAERVYKEPAALLKTWLPAILEDRDILELKLFRQESTLLIRSLWPLVDPVARHFGAQGREGELLSPMARRFLAVLDRHGATRMDRLKKVLNVRTVGDSKAFKLARGELEEYCLIVAWADPDTPRDPQGLIWETWDRFATRTLDSRLIPRSLDAAWAGLMEAAVRAAVVCPEKGIARWFPWTRDQARESLDLLLSRGVIERIEVQRESWIMTRSA
jgi:hypothetical protein